jgi:hypothetical protein
MIFSENRYTLFRIMLWQIPGLVACGLFFDGAAAEFFV